MTRSSCGPGTSSPSRLTRCTGSRQGRPAPSCPSSPPAAPTSTTCSRIQPSPAEDQHGLPARERERLFETVERHAQADELLERPRPAAAHLVERVDAREPVLPTGVDAAEEDAVLEHG